MFEVIIFVMFNSSNSSPSGFVWIVGGGPGASDLITVRGLRALEAAEVVIFDELAGRELLEFCPESCERINVGKRAGRHCASQGEINRMLVDHARRGLRVVRLKGGDPSVFAHLGEEIAALRAAEIPFAVVPGVTAACAAAAAAGVSLTHRAHASAAIFVTGHECAGKSDLARVDWESLARPGVTLCVYMGLRRLESVAGRLLAGGLPSDTPLTIVSHASGADQQVLEGTLVDAASLARLADGLPAMVLIGAALRPEAASDAAVVEAAGSALASSP